MAATARPRSPEASASSVPAGPCLATSAAATSGLIAGRLGADVDDQRPAAGRRDPLGEKGQFLALGVGRADDIDALHDAPRRRRALPQNQALHFLRRAYRIDMLVSRQSDAGAEEAERGPSRRPRAHRPADARDGDPADAGGRDAVGQRGRRSRRRVARHRLPLFSEPGGAGQARGRRGARADPDLVVRRRRIRPRASPS